jgi:hypothetical protein
MTDDTASSPSQASAIIERFGGIRPMASKMGVPVTTVQGWKQRGTVPENRMDDVRSAALAHGIDLEGILDSVLTESSVHDLTGEEKDKGSQKTVKVLASAVPSNLAVQNVRMTLIVAGVVVLAAAALGATFAIAPKVKAVGEQERRIMELEQEIRQMKEQQVAETDEDVLKSAVSDLIPQDIHARLGALQGKVEELSAQAKSYSYVLDDLKSGTLDQRLSALEGHMNQILGQANAMGLHSMMQKLQTMQQSSEGAASLDGVVASLLGAVQQYEGLQTEGGTGETPAPSTGADMAMALDAARKTDPSVAAMLEGVAPEDMKAAVMLIGLSQLRDSLARDRTSFDRDLGLLKVMAAKDDPELAQAIDRLAPQAKSGVLTPQGLSKEFRSLAGDIVVASLSGENVSLEDKAKARLGEVLKVEKNGVQVNGTDTQVRIAEAQKRLDAGDVEGAVAVLQDLQGPAAETAKPFIDQAQMTLLAGNVQQMVGQNIVGILSGLKGSVGHSAPYMVNPNSPGALMDKIETMVPGSQ